MACDLLEILNTCRSKKKKKEKNADTRRESDI